MADTFPEAPDSMHPGNDVRIVPYTPAYREAFFRLNQAWIERYFEMEPRDYQVLGNPQETILDPGGHILVALAGGQPVGVCALLASGRPGYDFELAKMGVDPASQGRGIGRALARAILEVARNSGARKIFLESSTRLPAALSLYRKLGFREIAGGPSPYKRSDIRMGLSL
ncbi:GNAT family N-acetyltransferase [Robiginitalea biformata]|uniref:GNAT family N-acetyltransferase n=1 Tax=Robiginitalea biformata TaxID=252307 RepID=UPI003B5CD16F